MFVPLDWARWDDYQQGWPVADSLSPSGEKVQIFILNVLGFQTHRDHFAIGFAQEDIKHRIQDMRDVSMSDQLLSEIYDISDNRDWRLAVARNQIRADRNAEQKIIVCSFRAFDNRPCFFGPEFMDYPRRELIDHVAGRENLQLLISRQIGSGEWRHTFCADRVAESCCVSDESTEQNYCFPLWFFEDGGVRRENLTAEFRAFIDARYQNHYSPEEVFEFVYAVLNSPAYRERYAAFLRIDFPRVPFPESSSDFDALSALGSALTEAHLLRDIPRRGLAQYHGRGEHTVEFQRYSEEDMSVAINATQSFRPIPKDVWNFHIGGYQVLDKYLKSRKGRALSLDEINHIAAVADSLAFTIEQMQRIDQAYRKAFPDRG
jgi:predicted helicase